jgi:hypothetical protein
MMVRARARVICREWLVPTWLLNTRAAETRIAQGHRSLIAGWAVKSSVQRLSGDGWSCRVMVLSAVGAGRRMMVSEAPAS